MIVTTRTMNRTGQPDATGGSESHLPRAQVGTTPQHLLMTLLGDYWYNRTEHLPSAALVDLLAEFGITEPSARASLNRLTKRGLLTSSKRGRNTYYGVDARALPLLQDMYHRYVAFGTEESRSWDGSWTLVAFSVPESERQLRHAVRSRLRWLGFAALYDGLWCSPWQNHNAVFSALSELGVTSATVVRASVDPRSTVHALSAWDLDAVRTRYLEFERKLAPMLRHARLGTLAASESLVQRTKVMDDWREFLAIEPQLPRELLPRDWPRSRVRALCFELHKSLGPVARARCRQIFANHSPDLALLVTPPGPDGAD